jgi:hypothetical protein
MRLKQALKRLPAEFRARKRADLKRISILLTLSAILSVAPAFSQNTVDLKWQPSGSAAEGTIRSGRILARRVAGRLEAGRSSCEKHCGKVKASEQLPPSGESRGRS